MSGEFGDNVSISSRRKSIAPIDANVSLYAFFTSISWKNIIEQFLQNLCDLQVPELPPEEEGSPSKFKMLDPSHMKALVWKNFLWMWRNVGIMLFIIGLPVVQIILFCLSIGKDPVGLRMGIVNNELNSSMEECVPRVGCDYGMLSCRFLKHLATRKIDFVPYDTEDEARYAITQGWAWGAIMFPKNYSESLTLRIEDGRSADDAVLEFSDMQVVMDMSSENHKFYFLFVINKVKNFILNAFIE